MCARAGVCAAGREAIWMGQEGEGEAESAIWKEESDKRRNSREEKSKEKKVETLLPTSTLLKLCAGPRDADRTLLLIHSPSSTSSPIFGSQCLCPCGAPRSVSSSS